jgi:anti-anti-sigma factor
MKLTERHLQGTAIVEVHGKLVGTPENCDAIHKTIRSLLDSGKSRIIVDLKNAPWANSQGIGMLIGAHTSVSNAGGRLVLASVGDRISDVLAVTRLDRVFKTFQSENTAVRFLTERPHPDSEARSQMTT